MVHSTYQGRLFETTWEAERERIAVVNPKLYGIIERLGPTKNHTFIKLVSPFGMDVYQEGQLMLPNPEGVFVSEKDPSLDQALMAKLSYGLCPLALILEKSVEIYVKRPDGRIIPFKVFYPGQTFGEWSIMPQAKIVPRQNWNWSVTAGARTVFFPFKTTDSASYARLKEQYHLSSVMPDSLFKHGEVFKEIVQDSDCNWRSEILFFTKTWLEPHPGNIAWYELKSFWADQAWDQFHYWSNRMILDFDSEEYVESLIKYKIKLKPYLLNTLKQVLSIACGTIPGFRVVNDTEIDVPASLIKDAYLSAYQLKTLPIMMKADCLHLETSSDAVYYSLQLPTMPESILDHGFPSTMKLLRELKLYIDFFIDAHSRWPSGSLKQDLNTLLNFDYYHSDFDKFKAIKSAKDLLNDDPSFAIDQENNPEKIFPESASFFRGCVKIQAKSS